MSEQPTQPVPTQPARKGRSCLFYGCLVFAIIVVLSVIGVVLGVRHYVNRAVAQYSETVPRALAKVQASASESKAVEDRVTAFKAAIEAGRATDPLELDERALNILLANAPNLRGLADTVHLSIEGDQVKGEVSIPLDGVPMIGAKGRYLNGSGVFKVSLDKGVLVVTLDSLEVKGQPLPEEIMAGLRQQNFARDVTKDARTAEWMRRLERIEVNNGKVIVCAAEPEANR